jgi:hypothetical protein
MATLAAIVERGRSLASQPKTEEGEAEVMRIVEEALRLAKTVAELMRWIYPPREPVSQTEAWNKVQALAKAGADLVVVVKVFEVLQTRPVGAPAKRRQSYIAAFEFMLQSKGNSQGQAVRRFCLCGNRKHGGECERNLKAGVRSLKKVLRTYAPELVARYDALHPDRAKKVNG